MISFTLPREIPPASVTCTSGPVAYINMMAEQALVSGTSPSHGEISVWANACNSKVITFSLSGETKPERIERKLKYNWALEPEAQIEMTSEHCN